MRYFAIFFLILFYACNQQLSEEEWDTFTDENGWKTHYNKVNKSMVIRECDPGYDFFSDKDYVNFRGSTFTDSISSIIYNIRKNNSILDLDSNFYIVKDERIIRPCSSLKFTKKGLNGKWKYELFKAEHSPVFLKSIGGNLADYFNTIDTLRKEKIDLIFISIVSYRDDQLMLMPENE